MTPNTKIFTDLLRENRAFLTVSAAEYGAGHNAAEAFHILPDSMLGVLVRHCETVSCAGGLLHLYGGGCELLENTLHIVLGGKTHRIPCGTPISNGFVPINGVLAQSGFCTAERRGGVVVVKIIG